MSDIRSFFGKPRTSAGTSALTQVKKDIQGVKNSPAKRNEKIVPKTEAATRKTDKHFEDIVDIDEDSSDGESPLPSSLRKKVQAKQKTKMRKRILVSSDESEDDFSRPPSRKRAPAKPSPSPQKQRPGKQKLDSSDDSFSPIKPKSKKKVVVEESDHDERSDESIRAVSEAEEEEEEEEDEFVETKKQRKGKKQLSTGQKKLSFSSQPVESQTKKDKEKSSAQSNSQQLKRISAADFFGTTVKKADSQSKEKTSPSQKENTPTKTIKKSSNQEKTASAAEDKKKQTPEKTTKTNKSFNHEKAEAAAEAKKKQTPEKTTKTNKSSNQEKTAAAAEAKKKQTPEKTTKTNKMDESNKQPDADKSAPTEKKEKRNAEPETKKTKPTPQVSPPKKITKQTQENISKDLDNEFVSSSDEEPPIKRKTPLKAEKPVHTSKSPKKVEQVVKKPTEVKKPEVKPAPPQSSSSEHVKSEVRSYDLPWVDKYRPKTIQQLIGQHGDKSPMNKLLQWLKDWGKHNLGEGAKIKKPKPAPWASQTDGTPFKAALLSGSPGVGKTTCAYMACEVLGLKFVEMNASDVRNKKHLEAQVAQLTGSHQIEEYFGSSASGGGKEEEVSHVLIMDEVDGMSGNEDRAGISELIQIIKDSKIPIVCICNDRSHPKMRSLVNHCYDLRFSKPRVENIRSRVMSIAAQEKVKINKEELDELIELSGHDVRQTIYNLQMRASSGGEKAQKKDVAINAFEAARKLLDSRSSLMEKQEMFFVDYGIMPLFVQENYLNMRNDKHKPAEAMSCLRQAADLISWGDVTDRCIRSSGNWKLLNEQCMLGCALPSLATKGHLRAMLQFPAWLGKNSTAGKRQRMMRQLAQHAHLKISGSPQALVSDYVPALRDALTRPLLEKEGEGVSEVVSMMTEYDLLRDDAEAIAELAVWPGKIDPGVKIQTKVKAALTRALNKEHRMLPYALDDVSKGKKKANAAASIQDVEIDEDGNLVERVDDDADADEEEEEKTTKVVVKTGGALRGGRGGARGRGRGRGK